MLRIGAQRLEYGYLLCFLQSYRTVLPFLVRYFIRLKRLPFEVKIYNERI